VREVVEGGYATVVGIVSISFVSFLGPKTRRRLGGDKKNGDVGHPEQGNKKTSVVTTSVETGGRLGAPGGHCGNGAGTTGAGHAGAQRLPMAGNTVSDVIAG
jgi:hypothetical protein